MNTETLAPCLSARTYAYTVLHVLLGDEPTEEHLSVINPELLSASFELMGAPRPEAMLEALAAGTDAEELHRQYMRCFVGPYKLPVPLWEAATRTGEDALFQEITLNVRKAYRASGFLPAEYPHVPDDHIALELDFLRALSQQAQDAVFGDVEGADNDGDAADVVAGADISDDASASTEDVALEGEVREALEASLKFLEGHLNVWADTFAKRLRASQASDFYASISEAAASFAQADAAWLTKVLA